MTGCTATSASSSSGGGSASTVTAIKANWESFFSASTPASKKLQLLQNGQAFSSLVNSQASGGLASQASAKVTSVTVNSATKATVKYQILLGGQPAPIPAQTGTAVYEGGTWKVGDASFCGLLALENNGKAPAGCGSAG
jgi:hypothetical protein